ncbi:RlmE family RNA methyltransferase [Aestuariivirga sp. YIM B02566]|uniref:RlmE family RNA methyltransferase n=1 Tax=Taklimakanibacter albus TaxID=2800327 RepID=A0ACC5QZE9_9HYPH|nr:RlmE family RNA methyltransferase [Aestuariivirga sp. YIM B02566]MBK1865765.1 RlmE family RNA methyltransferase [Aestuariivirga sp. YIM B02566]
MTRPGGTTIKNSRRLKVRVKTGKGRTVSQKTWLERQLNDPYVAEARKLGYRSRAAFKLSEIDDKFRFLKPGGRVVDLGAAPGGWSQVAVQRVKATEGKGKVIAIDMHGMDPIPGVVIFHKDFYDEDAPQLLIEALGGEKADVVMSDMAAHATGHRQTDHLKIMALAEAGFAFATDVLKPGGTFLAKVLRGGTEGEMLKMMKRHFESVRHVKPDASRSDSAELFVLAMGFRPID